MANNINLFFLFNLFNWVTTLNTIIKDNFFSFYFVFIICLILRTEFINMRWHDVDSDIIQGVS